MAFQDVLEGCKNAFNSCIDYIKLVILERVASTQDEIKKSSTAHRIPKKNDTTQRNTKLWRIYKLKTHNCKSN